MRGSWSRILDAGGIARSDENHQPWRFLVLRDGGLVDQPAQTVRAPPGLEADKHVQVVLSSGYPARARPGTAPA